MNIELNGKTALVTGGATGIGRACAHILSQAGAEIIIVDINLTGAQETVDALGHGHAIRCDLGDPEAITALRRAIEDKHLAVDILVNCAGIISYKKGIGAVPVKEWDLVLNVNLRGTYLICQAFIEGMKEKGGGSIINFSSLAARVGGIEVGIHYASSKSALIGFTRTLAKEGGPYHITVNTVAPGVILTEPVKKQLTGKEEAYISQIPLRRLGQPEDVANVVLFLCSPLASYITGVVLDINGGLYMG
ncbi:MAG: SDR family NAD(P)-dependent oxidoreductase [Anaerolineae bacterium]|nr:SDR family NAD(P)-dependent oxidoreductase [Anaerolineae bacterium]